MRRFDHRPMKAGTRVHHRAQEWTAWWGPGEQENDPQWGWGTILSAVPQRDGSFEYEIQRDAPITGEKNDPTWWASYHIDGVCAPRPVVVVSQETDRTEEAR